MAVPVRLRARAPANSLFCLSGVVWPVWGSSNEILASHGILVPDYFWKVIYHSNDSIAWIIPNKDDAKKQRLDKYLTSIAEIEQKTDFIIDVPNNLKNQKQSTSWDTGYCETNGPVGWKS